jgi:hypothetical protein
MTAEGERYKYSAMTSVETESIKDKYTPDTFFDEWSPCITASWSHVYDSHKKTLRNEWLHLDKSADAFIFPIPEKVIHGSIFLDGGHTYFRDYHKGRLSKLRIRYNWIGHNIHILGAFWIPHQQTIIVHDMFMYDGESLCEKGFRDRWTYLKKFIESDYEEDRHLQGFQMKIIDCDGLSRKADTYGVLYQPNMGLATIIHSIPYSMLSGATVVHKKSDAVQIAPTVQTKVASTTARFELKKHKKFNGPEAFQIWNGEEDLGMPSIQSLSLTRAIRDKLASSETVMVSAKWNKDLSSYEVTALA